MPCLESKYHDPPSTVWCKPLANSPGLLRQSACLASFGYADLNITIRYGQIHWRRIRKSSGAVYRHLWWTTERAELDTYFGTDFEGTVQYNGASPVLRMNISRKNTSNPWPSCQICKSSDREKPPASPFEKCAIGKQLVLDKYFTCANARGV